MGLNSSHAVRPLIEKGASIARASARWRKACQ